MKEEDCRSNQTIMYIREKLKVSNRNLLGLVGATESTLLSMLAQLFVATRKLMVRPMAHQVARIETHPFSKASS